MRDSCESDLGGQRVQPESWLIVLYFTEAYDTWIQYPLTTFILPASPGMVVPSAAMSSRRPPWCGSGAMMSDLDMTEITDLKFADAEKFGTVQMVK